jgi:hypothetical protein
MEYRRVSYVFSEEQLNLIHQSITTIKETIEPTRVSITPKDRMRLMKMGDGSHPFTEQSLKHANRNPEFMPSFSSVEEFKKDWDLTMQFKEIKNALMLLNQDVDNTYIAAGADAFANARDYYNSAQRGAANNEPGAQSIVDDLKPRWLKRFNKVEENKNEEQNPSDSEPSPATSGSSSTADDQS